MVVDVNQSINHFVSGVQSVGVGVSKLVKNRVFRHCYSPCHHQSHHRGHRLIPSYRRRCLGDGPLLRQSRAGVGS